MGRNLGPLNIKDSYEGLVQISGSDQLTDGSGSLISSLDVNAATATSASFATTASFALNVTPIDTGSLMVTGSVTDATLTFTKGDGSTFDLTVDNVVNATSASFATTATNAVSASIADSATTALLATTASHAIFADTASFLPADTNLNINSITASNASFTSASIGYLQTITGSAKIIGDAFIILNNNLPTERYAGLVVQDSGSGSPLTTSSLQYDGQTDDWFYEYSTDGGVTVDHGIAMFGPEYSVKGVPTYLSNNTIPKGDGGHHLNDSNITDDGTLVTIDANVSASGYVSASSFIGDGSQLSGIDACKFNDGAGFESLVGQMLSSGSNNSPQGFLFASGSSITSTGVGAVILGGTDHTDSGNGYSAVIGGLSNDITGNFGGAIFGGRDNTANAYFSAIVGGNSNSISSGLYCGIFAGDDNSVAANYSVIAGGSDNVNNGQNSGICGGINHTINPAAANSGLLGGNGHTLTGNTSVAVGGYQGTVTNTRGAIVGGYRINATGIQAIALGGGAGNTAAGQDSAVLAGLGNVANGTRSATIVGENNTVVSGHTYSVVVGGSGLSTTKAREVVVPSLTTNGAVVQNVEAITITSNTGSLDASLGNMFTLTLQNGVDTHLELSNQTAGQTFSLKITNNATSAGTISFDSQFDFEGGTAFEATAATNAVDILTFTTFDGSNVQCVGSKNFS